MHYFLIIQQLIVNYSAYTTVVIPQGIVQVISTHFSGFISKILLRVGLISYTSHLTHLISRLSPLMAELNDWNAGNMLVNQICI